MTLNQSLYRFPDGPSVEIKDRLRYKTSINGHFLSDMSMAKVSIQGSWRGEFYHFRIFLVSSRGDSISLQILPDPLNGMRGTVGVEYNNYQLADSTELLFEIPIFVRHVTGRHLVEMLLNDRRMDQYTFTPEGQGCRHWCATAIEHLVTYGFVRRDAAAAFDVYEQEQLKLQGRTAFPWPRIMGTFY